jgi:hypothetical protein
MKLLAKMTLVLAIGGAGATMYAAPGGGGFLSPTGTSGGAAIGANMTFEQMIGEATRIQIQITDDYRHVQHLQQIARREKDLIKLNCVNDKLIELKAQMNVADRSHGELQGGLDPSDQRQALTNMSVAGDEVKRLREAADQCIGEKLLITESSNEYTHPDIGTNPTDNPFPGELEPPAYASPFD